MITCCLFGCALFKKTSREVSLNTASSLKQRESSQLVLKTKAKETQIFTYWTDSGVYQYQRILEQSDQAQMTELKKKETQRIKQKTTTAKSRPAYILIFVLLIVVGALVLWLRRFCIHNNVK